MNDLEKLKNHFEGFKNLEFINSESIQSRVDAFERFCQKGVPSLKQEHWKYSPLSKDLIHFQNLKFSLNQDKSFNDAHFEKFDHYRVLLKDGALISEDIKEEGLEITKYKQDQFYEIKKNQILDFNNAFFSPGFEISVDSNTNIKKPIVIYNYFSKEFDGNNINNKNFIYLDKNSKAENWTCVIVIYSKSLAEIFKRINFRV